MTELKEEHFEVIDRNKDKDYKKKTYRPLPDNLFIEESLINGQGLFASNDIPAGTDLGVSHVEIEKDKMSPKELIRTPLGGFINHEPLITKLVKIDEDTNKKVEVSGPNCERKRNRNDGNKAEWNLITRKDIKAGEELTVEYNLYNPE
jgi:SET domain-containing protein